jgi:hypothetical protein
VKPLTEALQAAGARVTGRIDVKEAWTDPARSGDRDSVLRSLPATAFAAATGAAGGSATVAPATGAAGAGAAAPAPTTTVQAATTPVPSVSGATNAGSALTGLLARAVVTTDLGRTGQLDAEASRLLDGLRKAGLVGVNGDLTGPATEVVVLAPGVTPVTGNAPSASASAAGDQLAQWTSIAVGLDARSDGVVVVGPASSATSGGVVETVRAQSTVTGTVSTVDTGGTPMGDVATVLALREQSLGGAGSYGFVGKVKAPLPVLSEVKS